MAHLISTLFAHLYTLDHIDDDLRCGRLERVVLEANQVEFLANEWKVTSPLEILQNVVERVPNLALACSFGAEDMVLLDMLVKVNPNATVFYLDTDVLFEETYELRDRAVQKYGLPNLLRVATDVSLEQQAQAYGEALWARDPNLCCNIRKVRPLQQVLGTLDAWVTGIRRDQSPTRANVQVLEVDSKFGLLKVNPLAFWTEDQVWSYIRRHDVPYNPLHDSGYPSIGCIHCTRPVAPGGDARSGRWAGFEKTECGLHR
jgi:phosphoadenosine phosphosulfate reductase